MISLVSQVESPLDDTGAIKGISIVVDEETSADDWFPPWPYMGHDLPFSTKILRVREKGKEFKGLYHRERGLIVPCIFSSIRVLNIADRLLVLSRPRDHIRNLVCGVTGGLLFAGLTSASRQRTDDPLVTKYLVKVRKKTKGHKIHELLVIREIDEGVRFQRVLTRIS